LHFAFWFHFISVISVFSVAKKVFMNRKKLIFITGGARSGKSDFALKLAQRFAGRKAYLATARALDEEMAERIQKHKRNRPQDWQTLEEPLGVAKVLKEGAGHFSVILLDCLTLWISNSLMAKWGEKKILREADRLLEASQGMKGTVIIVSNEVGLGIVPDNPSARIFRDLSGLIHQKVARQADEVYFMVNGLPLQLKNAKRIAQRA
jgi:adenosylcobinamide kinase/adenosylcobinamide-phosphate guanylyltransferase